MKVLKKILIVTLIICILFSGSSYAMTQSAAGKTMAEFADNFYNDHREEVAYSTSFEERGKAYNGEMVDGKYRMDCVGWINFVVHQALGLEVESTT